MIVFQRFPARVVMSDGRTYDPTAVVVTEDSRGARRAQVAERRGATVNIVADVADVDDVATVAPLVVETLSNRSTLITFGDTLSWEVSRGKGCSCGSPLKRWFLSTVAAG